MKYFLGVNVFIFLLTLCNINAQQKAFVYIKSTPELRQQIQEQLADTLAENYTISQNKKLFSLLSKNSFLQKESSKEVRQSIFAKGVAFILLVKCEQIPNGYRFYSRMIQKDRDVVLRITPRTSQQLFTQFNNYLRETTTIKNTPPVVAPESSSKTWTTKIIHHTVIGLTCLAISSIFIYSIFLLFSKGKIIFTLCVLQLLLFQVLFVQIYYWLGQHHFEHGASDPYWYQWILFMVFHVFRAIDIIDFLEEFNIGIYFLKHRTILCGSTIVIMRLMIDAFVIALTVKFLETRMQKIYSSIDAFKRRWKNQLLPVSLMMAIVFLGIYSYCAVSEKWFVIDALLLWPVDNFLRVIDIGDCFQTFDWTLHFVFDSTLHSSMEVVFRFATGVLIAKWVDRLTTTYFRGMGLTLDEILDNLEHKDLNVVKIMLKKLRKIGPEVKEKAVPRFLKIVTIYQLDFKIHKTLRKEYIFFDEDVPVAAQNNLDFTLVKTLQAIDKNGEELCKYFAASDTRESASKLLSTLGPQCIPYVMRFLENTNPNIREEALNCLNNMTSPAGKWCHTLEYLNELPIVLRMLHSFDIEIKIVAIEIIKNSKITSSIAGNAIPIIRKMHKEEESREMKKLCQEVIDIYKGICFDDNGNYICY
ncbi:hypothetical protein [Candidatus Uabimicrobium amorphum]|uniref:HEAT repeat domain-containing protein n=1 Tax=Uabimicrobium amorphum TaxID=2596890 RepID=A0A5S9F2V9_UABAM|nr:hypothetical protein [Candidatus Uabimicrobium amorphum]BBM84097.1 hypothetical protein UABAM_02453 [Candidatus Uabimicrobium amorphum]